MSYVCQRGIKSTNVSIHYGYKGTALVINRIIYTFPTCGVATVLNLFVILYGIRVISHNYLSKQVGRYGTAGNYSFENPSTLWYVLKVGTTNISSMVPLKYKPKVGTVTKSVVDPDPHQIAR